MPILRSAKFRTPLDEVRNCGIDKQAGSALNCSRDKPTASSLMKATASAPVAGEGAAKDKGCAAGQPGRCDAEASSKSHVEVLDAVLHAFGCYETEEEREAKRVVLVSLSLTVKQWIQSLGLSRGMHWRDIDQVGGKIVTFGSYKLDISYRGADIDALCIAPQFISRKEFFTSFYNLLDCNPEITELRAIPEAYVPVIKFRYNGIEIDVTFAQLLVDCVPASDEDLFNSSLICDYQMNPKSTVTLLKLVPSKNTFRMGLRAVKLWAQNQGLYSNILGYLGGFSWAVLMAKVCIDHPNLNAAQTVQKFFHVFATWNWSNPVHLTPYKENDLKRYNCPEALIASSWNPDKNVNERFYAMAILTPSVPVQNSTFNVSVNTVKLIQSKLCMATKICDAIMEGKELWPTLFETCHVYHEYERFLIVIASAFNPIQWFGLIESKIRRFVSTIEKESSNCMTARIWPRAFIKKNEKTLSTSQLWFIGLKVKPHYDFDHILALKHFKDALMQFGMSFYSADMKLDGHYILKSQLALNLCDVDIKAIVLSQTQKSREGACGAVKSAQERCFNNLSHSYASVLSPCTVNGSCNKDGSTTPSANYYGRHQTRRLFTTPSAANSPQASVLTTATNTMTTTICCSTKNNTSTPLPASCPTAPRLSSSATTTAIASPTPYARPWRSPATAQGNSCAASCLSSESGSSSASQSIEAPNLSSNYSASTAAMALASAVPSLSLAGSTKGSPDLDMYYSSCDSTSSSTGGLFDVCGSVESDSCRTVSFSSDKFPPASLISARLHHFDSMPCSPLSNTTGSFDMAVTTSPGIASKLAPFGRVPSRPADRSHQQRQSANEIHDVSTPLPVQTPHYAPLRFNFNSSTIAQMSGHTNDSVFY